MPPNRLPLCALVALALVPSSNASAQDRAETGSIFVSNTFDGTVSVISASSRRVTATIPIVARNYDQVSANLFRGTISDTINGLSLSPDGSKVYIGADVETGTTPDHGILSVISTESDSVTDIISDPATLMQMVVQKMQAGSGPAGAKLAIHSPDHSKTFAIFALNDDPGILVVFPAVKPQTSSIPGALPGHNKFIPTTSYTENMRRGFSSLGYPVISIGRYPADVAVSPDGQKVYVTNQEDETVSVISSNQNTVIATIHVGISPEGIAVSPDGKMVYVVNHGDTTNNFHGTVSVISAADNMVIATISVGRGPTGVVVIDKPAESVPFATVLTDQFLGEITAKKTKTN